MNVEDTTKTKNIKKTQTTKKRHVNDHFLKLGTTESRKQSKTYWKTNVLRIRTLERFGTDLGMFKKRYDSCSFRQENQVGSRHAYQFPRNSS